MGCYTRASSWSWSAFSFVNSFSWRLSISVMRFWSCGKVFVSAIAFGWGCESVRGFSRLMLDWVLSMDGCRRIDKRPQGMFYWGPTVGAKCSYQNSELWHIRVDMGSRTSHVGIEGTIDKRGDLQNKGLRRSSKNVCKESKASNIENSLYELKRERGAQACCHVLSVWEQVVYECVLRGSMELVFIVDERGCWSLFVGVVC